MELNLGSVQRTLLIPLWCRAKFTAANSSILTDPKALEIVKNLDFDFEKIDRNVPFFSSLMFLARANMLDEAIKSFISVHRNATIVNLGAGLDTTFFRIDNGLIRWFDIDLPDVAELRRKIIPDTERLHNIAGSIFDLKWVDDITPTQGGLLFISGGVFSYYREKMIKEFLSALAGGFPESELVCDTLSKAGVFIANCGTRIKGLTSEPFYWGMKDANRMTKWDRRIVVVDQCPLFSGIKRETRWSGTVKNILNFSDRHRLANIIHLKFCRS